MGEGFQVGGEGSGQAVRARVTDRMKGEMKRARGHGKQVRVSEVGRDVVEVDGLQPAELR